MACMDRVCNTPEIVQPFVETLNQGGETILSWCLEDAAVKAAWSRKDTEAIGLDYVCHHVEDGGFNNKRGFDKMDQ